MNINDDLTSLVTPGGAPQTEFRQGVVVTFDSSTGNNTINVAGSVLTNVPTLNPLDAINYATNTVLLLLRMGASWVIVGRPALTGQTNGLFVQETQTDNAGSFDLATGSGVFATPAGQNGSVTAPPWANRMAFFATATMFATNTSASADFAYVQVLETTTSATSQPMQMGLAVGATGCVTSSKSASSVAITGGATFSLRAQCRTNANAWPHPTGTNHPNTITVDGIFTFSRV